jgi:transposase InsO family protein
MKPMTSQQELLLHTIYFDKKFMFGRDKLFQYIRQNYPDSNISRREVSDWLSKQEISQIFHKTQPTKDLRSQVITAPYNQIGIDIVDFQNWEYEKYKYVLTAKDLFSKKVWVEALKDKEGLTVFKGIKNILDQMLRTPTTIRSDNGSEFNYEPLKAYLKKIGCIQIFSAPGKPQSNGSIERFNGQMKRLLNMYMTQTNSKDWVTILPIIIDNYNNVQSRITGKTPNELDVLKVPNKREITARLKKAVNKKNINTTKTKNAFKLGDKVRLKIIGDKFQKLNGQNFSEQVFTIYKIFKSKSEQSEYYYVKSDNKEYTEKLYPEDLLLITTIENPIPEKVEKFEISKLVKPLMVKNGSVYVQSYEVQWKRYKKEDNTIEPRAQLLEDVPKMIKLYEQKYNVEWKPKSVKFSNN